MRSILLILLTIFFCLPAFSQEPLKATVTKEWTVDTAREEAFKNVEYTKDLSEYPAIDPNLIENRIAIQNKQEKVGNRRINYYSNGYYDIRIMEDGCYDKGFAYSNSGNLLSVQFLNLYYEVKTVQQFENLSKDKNNYPIKAYSYSYPNGNFLGVDIYVNEKDSFFFNIKGELIGYIKNNRCYDSNGKFVYSVK